MITVERPGRLLRGDAGVAGVLMLTLCGVLALVASLVVALAAVGVARQRAAAVADLSALAAAGAALQGQALACERAARVAAANGGALGACSVIGDVAVVLAEVRPPGPLGELGVASARARAGPVGLDGHDRATGG